MMKEILGVTSEPETHRRWFHDEFFDLFICQAPDGEIVSFQLCYGQDSSERALVWSKQRGFFHDGARPPVEMHKAGDPVLARFDIAATDLPAELRSTLIALVKEYARAPAVPSRRKRFRRAEWQKLAPHAR